VTPCVQLVRRPVHWSLLSNIGPETGLGQSAPLGGGPINSARLALSARQIADPRPSPSLAAAEDEPSWLVQFDGLVARLPQRRAFAATAKDNSAGTFRASTLTALTAGLSVHVTVVVGRHVTVGEEGTGVQSKARSAPTCGAPSPGRLSLGPSPRNCQPGHTTSTEGGRPLSQ
jgi:hypothetical protein